MTDLLHQLEHGLKKRKSHLKKIQQYPHLNFGMGAG